MPAFFQELCFNSVSSDKPTCREENMQCAALSSKLEFVTPASGFSCMTSLLNSDDLFLVDFSACSRE